MEPQCGAAWKSASNARAYAEICRAAAAMLMIGTELHVRVCGVCAEICDACAASCEETGDTDECVEACRRCAQACREMESRRMAA